MLLVIDVGNTNTVLGIFDGNRLIKDWRIRTERNTTEDEFFVLAFNLFTGSNIRFDEIKQTVISCVVPPVVMIYESFCRKYLNHAPVWIDAKTVTAMPILYGNPSEVGADRIVNAVAAYDKYKTSLIVIDFGTATTFDVISEKGEYLGGGHLAGRDDFIRSPVPESVQTSPGGTVRTSRCGDRKNNRGKYTVRHYFRIRRTGRRHCASHGAGNGNPSQGDRNRGAGPTNLRYIRNYSECRTQPCPLTDYGLSAAALKNNPNPLMLLVIKYSSRFRVSRSRA